MNDLLKTSILWFIFFINFQSFAQISFDDPLTVIKDPEGKVLKKTDMEKIMKSGKQFSMYSVKKGDTTVYHLQFKTKDEISKKKLVSSNLKSSLLNKPLPKFSMNSVNDEAFSEASIVGKITVFNFWFTGCVPCIREMPKLNELVDKFEDRVNFLAPTFNTKEQIQTFLSKKDFKYNILYDSKDFNKVLKIEFYPTHIIVDAEGIVREVIFGANPDIKKQIEDVIKHLLKKDK